MQGFDYELVNISYSISGKWISKDAPSQYVSVTDKNLCFILPSGKAIEQNPTVEKVNGQGKWTHSSGQVFVENLVFTIVNDPAQEIEKIIFVPELIKDTKEPYQTIQLPSVTFEKKFSNQNTGVAKFVSSIKASSIYSAYTWPGFDPLNNGVFYALPRNSGPRLDVVARYAY